VIIALIPAGAMLGFLGGLLIEIIVGLIAGAGIQRRSSGDVLVDFLGSLPGLGALIGAILTPTLYPRPRGAR
jgi:hypothetical protein